MNGQDITGYLFYMQNTVNASEFAAPQLSKWLRWQSTLSIVALLMLMAVLRGPLYRGLPALTWSPTSGLNRLTADSGLTTEPAVSKDGKWVVYASDRSGEGNLDLYLQPAAGGAPSRLTHSDADAHGPAFSPDGNLIAFRSEQRGGGIYVTPVKGGEARRVAAGGHNPQFSPDGGLIAYWCGGLKDAASRIYVVPSRGGSPRQIAPAFYAARYPIWSSDGRRLLFLGTREAGAAEDEQDNWWIVPLAGGSAVNAQGSGLFFGEKLRGFRPVEWTLDNRIRFSDGSDDNLSLWQVTLSPATWQITGPAQQVSGFAQRLSAGPDLESGFSLSADGHLGLARLNRSANVWSLPIDANTGRVTGEMERLTQHSSLDWYPSANAQGDKVVFQSNRSGSWDIWVKDRQSGAEKALTSTPAHEFYPRISADGSQVAYWTTEPDRRSAIYVLPVSGGRPRRVCVDCGEVQDWSPDGKRILYAGASGIFVLDIARQQKVQIIGHASGSLSGARFSPDGRWIAFQGAKSAGTKQTFIAPFRGEEVIAESEWIAITDGSTLDRNAAWSPDGNLLYLLSERDGSRCIWAQRLNPATKQPSKAPFAVQHFHSMRLSPLNASGTAGLSVAGNQLVFTLGEVTGNVWMAQLRTQK